MRVKQRFLALAASGGATYLVSSYAVSRVAMRADDVQSFVHGTGRIAVLNRIGIDFGQKLVCVFGALWVCEI